MIEFAWPWVFLALPLPLLARRLMPPAVQNAEAALRVPFFERLEQVSGGAGRSLGPERRRLIYLALIWCCLVAAAARPQWLGDPVELPVSGRDLMMAVDVSGSMEEGDMIVNGRRATRLDAVKLVAQQFIARREGDRIGLILFGSHPYLQTPLTFDRHAVAEMLGDAVPNLAGPKTAIGDAIGLAVKRLRDADSPHRVLVLLSDGANTEGSLAPAQAAELAARTGLRIYTIGLASDPPEANGLFGFMMSARGNDLDEESLREVARITGGRYFRARDSKSLESIYQTLDELEPVQRDTETFRPMRALFYWPLLLAAGLALLWPLLTLASRAMLGLRRARELSNAA